MQNFAPAKLLDVRAAARLQPLGQQRAHGASRRETIRRVDPSVVPTDARLVAAAQRSVARDQRVVGGDRVVVIRYQASVLGVDASRDAVRVLALDRADATRQRGETGLRLVERAIE